MAQTNAQTLAAALSAAQGSNDNGTDDPKRPIVDRLANALALPSADPTEDDDSDDDLDLPMLVHGNGERALALVPIVTAQRVREGRAAVIGFGLAAVMLVPLGVVMSNRMPEPVPRPAVASLAPVTQPQAFVPARLDAIEDVGIRIARRPTQSVPTAAAAEPAPVSVPAPVAVPITEPPAVVVALPAPALPVAPPVATPEPLPAPVVVEIVTPAPQIHVAMPPVPVPPVPPAPAQPPPPDRLAEAEALIKQGDVLAARTVLESANPAANPLAAMALAETFDPNFLAAWNVRAAHPDVERARELYRSAFASGVMKARQRLEALQ